MAKQVLDVGNCAMDHASIKSLIESNFDAKVVQAHQADHAVAQLAASRFDLVLINRILDQSGESGLELIQQIYCDDRFKDVPVMLITNYTNYLQDAVQRGAVGGFGKNELGQTATLEKLRNHLE